MTPDLRPPGQPGDDAGYDSASGVRCLRISLRADLAELERARRLIDRISELCPLSEERTFDVKVAVSEACANAIEHASSSALVVAWILSDRVLIEISNDGGFLPGLKSDTDARRRGLGLPLMAALADQVHVSRLSGGITRVSLTFFLPPGNAEPPLLLPQDLPCWRSRNAPDFEIVGAMGPTQHRMIFDVVEAVAAAPTLRHASSALLDGARDFTGCEGGMLRLRGGVAERGEWLPALIHTGLRDEFLKEEALIRGDECMCGRVCMGLTDPDLPFFTKQGSFLWGRAQTLAAEFGTEALGEIRGRCIAEGFESVAIFPLGGENGAIGVLHLVDHGIEKFKTTSRIVEWACRVSGRIMSKGGTRERAAAVRRVVKELRPSA